MAEQVKVLEQDLPPIDAKGDVKVSGDSMEAYLILREPLNGGAALKLEQIKELLSARGVNIGVLYEVLEKMAREPVYEQPVPVAQGVRPVDGADAELTYFVRLEKDLKPKENPDGTVNFKDLDLIEYVEKETVLCEKTPATPGTAGRDVLGRVVAAKPGRDKNLPAGKNTVLSQDKLKLLANISGQVEYIANKLSVLDTFTVRGDVSVATGDVRFVGNIIVTGGVTAGFTVQASGNVDISGVVEGAHIVAGGSIIVRGGFNGGDQGQLEAGGNITCRFIQGGQVTLGGSLETMYILNAVVNCGDSINLTGKGLIIGGHVTALKLINCASLGSASSSANTIIEVGSDPELVRRSRDIPKEIETCGRNLQSVETLLKLLLGLKQSNRLTPEKADQLEKSAKVFGQLRAKLQELHEENIRLQEKMSEVGNGMIKVSKTAYPGVKVVIGAEQMPLHSEYTFVTFRRTDQGIVTVPLR